MVVEPVSSIPTTMFRTRSAVLDRDGLAALVPADEPGPGPSADAVDRLVREFFRTSGMPEVIVVRDDWLLAVEHVHHLRGLLYALYVEANAPLPAMGIKQWSTKLTAAQRAVLSGLPTSATSVAELADAHVRVGAAFLRVARPLAGTWPTALEDAARSHVRDVLGIDEPYPG